MSWRILPGARDDILGTARPVVIVLPLNVGILRPARDCRSILGPSALGPGTPHPGNRAQSDLVLCFLSLIEFPPAPFSRHPTNPHCSTESVVSGPRVPASGRS